MKKFIFFILPLFINSCKSISSFSRDQSSKGTDQSAFVWEGANVYFLLTDRFKNGNPNNDVNFNRTENTAPLRGFEGGDLRGIIQKIDENYFTDLGVNVIWMTPIVEQIHGATDEGTGNTYGYHGYWTKDWTALEPNFGTKADLKELVTKAHNKGIRILLDAVVNHTGPVTSVDPVYPDQWVRTGPKCSYNSYKNTTACTLVSNLPDIITESNEPAKLPSMLVEKWKNEGRYEAEMNSLNAFFETTGFPRAPKYYIMKWLADYVREFGIDGYRVDTVKHTNEEVWKDFQQICQKAFEDYKKLHPEEVLDHAPFFTVGEVYGYGISQKKWYDFGDKQVNYYDNGLKALINFDFKNDANKPFEEIFAKYSQVLQHDLNGNTVLNYLSSHDDGEPFDKSRTKTYEAATKLLLAPGMSQIYYGEESARSLNIPGTQGDATLRSNMNWQDQKNNLQTKKLLSHYQKLGQFRASHPAVGAGKHEMISSSPYWFSRSFRDDRVVIGLDLPIGNKIVNVTNIFKEGDKIRDAYSGATMVVIKNEVSLNTDYNIVLLEKI